MGSSPNISEIVAPQAPPGTWHQDSQQDCNAPHSAIQDTNLQWHSMLGLVPHSMDLTAGGLISQSQIAGKCTNSAGGTTKLNDTAPNAPKESVGTAPHAPGEMKTRRRRRRGNELWFPKIGNLTHNAPSGKRPRL
eukprot:gene14926-biopygen18666